MHHTSDTIQSRYQRFRSKRKAQGMKELRLWMPDRSVTGFREEALRQSKLLSEQTKENEALEFIEAAVRSIEDWKKTKRWRCGSDSYDDYLFLNCNHSALNRIPCLQYAVI